MEFHYLQQKTGQSESIIMRVRVCQEGGDRLIPICVTSHSLDLSLARKAVFQIGGHVSFKTLICCFQKETNRFQAVNQKNNLEEVLGSLNGGEFTAKKLHFD